MQTDKIINTTGMTEVSVFSSWTCKIIELLRWDCDIVDLRYVFSRAEALLSEESISPTFLVVLGRVTTSSTAVLWVVLLWWVLNPLLFQWHPSSYSSPLIQKPGFPVPRLLILPDFTAVTHHSATTAHWDWKDLFTVSVFPYSRCGKPVSLLGWYGPSPTSGRIGKVWSIDSWVVAMLGTVVSKNYFLTCMKDLACTVAKTTKVYEQ